MVDERPFTPDPPLIRIVCLAALLAVPGALAATEFLPQLTVGSEYSDNILRSDSDRLRGSVVDVLGGIRAFEDGRRLRLDADFTDLYRTFPGTRLAGENLPAGYLDVVGNLLPGRLEWSASDSLGQISMQPFDALLATDRQTVNSFATGPELLIPFSVRDHLRLSARYDLARYGRSDLDSSRYDGSASLIHQLSPASALSLGYGFRRRDYRASSLAGADDTVQTGFLGYFVESYRTYLGTEAGMERLRTAGSAGPSTTPHVTFALQRRLAPWLTLNGEYSHGFSDSEQNFRYATRDTFGAGSTQNVQPVAAAFIADRAYLMLLRNGQRALLAVEVTWSRENYPGALRLDRTIRGSNLALEYRLSSRLSFSARARWEQEQARDPNAQYTRVDGSVGLNERLNPHLQVALAVLVGNGTGNTAFREHRVMLVITYAARPTSNRLFDASAEFRQYERPLREQASRYPPPGP